MNLPLDFHEEAVKEVDAAYAWYEDQRTGLGVEFFTAFLEQLDLIQHNPEGWAILYRKVRACPMRRFPYVIYYRMQSDRINVIAVQHGHRHPRAWRTRT